MKRLIKKIANEENFKYWYILPIENWYMRNVDGLSVEEKKNIIDKYSDEYEGKEWVVICGDYGCVVSDGESVRYSESMPTNEGFSFKNKEYDGNGNDIEDFLNDKKQTVPNVWYECSYEELKDIAGNIVNEIIEKYH